EGVRLYNYSSSAATETHRFEEYPILVKLRKLVEEALGENFNFVLLNYYVPDSGLGFHSDDELDMLENSAVASLSVGQIRHFDLQEKLPKQSKEVPMRIRVDLAPGSLLIMEGQCQKVFKHRVPPQKTNHMRINLTFRK